MKTITRNILLALTFLLTTNAQTIVAQTVTAEPKTKKTESDDNNKKEKTKPAKKSNFTRLSPEFVSVFKSVSKSMESATVTVLSEGKQVSLGTIVDADGLILTKASELKQNLVCKIGDEKFKAEVVGIHGKTDLALLKIDADALNPIQWAEQQTNQVGNWVVSPKAQEGDCAIGVVSTQNIRQIKRSRPFVGVTMTNKENGVLIKSVVNRSPADISGLLVGDVIFKVDNQPVKEIKDLQNILGQFDAGDRVTLDVIRYQEEIQVRVTLAEYEKLAPSSQRRNQQNSMGSELSRRRKDFPLALQHDSMLQSNTCGGPLLDLSGNAIGINIARAGRVASYALPVKTLLPVIELLKTGDLAPAIVNKGKIAALEAELKQLRQDIEALPEKRAVLNIQVSSQMAVRDAQRKTVADFEKLLAEHKKRLTETEARLDKFRSKMNFVRKKLRTGEKTTSRLNEQLDGLKTGSR